MKQFLLEANNVEKYYSGAIYRKKVYALQGVSFGLLDGERLGVLGESGSGKTTLCKLLVRLEKPTSGNILYNNTDITNLSEKKLGFLRKNVQIIFQNSMNAMNPKHTIGTIIEEPMEIQTTLSFSERFNKTQKLLHDVGLQKQIYESYPHELSGGQRQRVAIARALSLEPKVLICDEPVTSLDVSMKAQILNLLLDLQQTYNLSMIFVSHDIDIVSTMSEKILVMHSGTICEILASEEIFSNAQHPYTQLLIASLLEFKRKTIMNYIEKQNHKICNNLTGCSFYNYCSIHREQCKTIRPELREIASNHWCACHAI